MSRISDRQREVMGLVAKGASNQAIAGSLGIAEATVKVHLKRIFAKLGVRNRTQLARFILSDQGLLPPLRYVDKRSSGIEPPLLLGLVSMKLYALSSMDTCGALCSMALNSA